MRASLLLSALSLAAVSLLACGASAQAPLVPWAVVHHHETEAPVITAAPDDYAPILSGRSTVSAPIPGSAATGGPLVPRTIFSPTPDLFNAFSSPASGSSWTAIGPNTVQYFQGGNLDAGRLAGIAVDPTDVNTFYVAAAGGGVWKTTNGGASYVPLTDFLGDTAMGSIAVAPSDRNTIYAGTGEANYAVDCKYGIGLLKSTNGGATWSVIPGPINPSTGQGAFYREGISKIVVAPTDPKTVYLTTALVTYNSLGGNFGVWKTTDGGTTWNNMTGLAGLDTFYPYTDLVMDPNNPQTLYTAIGYTFDSSQNGIFKTTNGGTTWAKLGGGLPTAQVGRISLALAASSPQILYASIARGSGSMSGSLLGLYKTINGGTAWAQMTNAPDYLGQQGYYDNAIVVSPTNANAVFAAGQLNYNDNGLADNRILVGSLDGGATFKDYSYGTGIKEPHTDTHALVFTHDGAKLLHGSDGGVWRLANPYVTPIPDFYNPNGSINDASNLQWTDLNANLDTIQFYGIALHPTDPKTVYGGAQDNGTEKTTDAGTTPWAELEFGDTTFMRVDRSSPNTVYNEGASSVSLERSDDGGTTFTAKTNGINTSDPVKRAAPYKLDPSSQSRIIYASDHVYESTDKGDNFHIIGTPGSGGNGFNPNPSSTAGQRTVNAVTALGVAGPTGSLPGAIYASANSHLFATFNAGTTWTDVSVPGLNANLSDIYVNPLNPKDVTVAKGAFDDPTVGIAGKVFRSTNGGITWANITGILPDEPFNAVVVDQNSHTLYAGGDEGVYSSPNFGGTWTKLSIGLPDVQVTGLDLSNTTGLLGASTFGRGVWTFPLTVAVGVPTANTQSVAVPFNTAEGITLTGSDPDNPPLALTYTITGNPTHGTLSGLNAATGAVTYTPTAGYTGPDSFTFAVSNGTNTSPAATVSVTVHPIFLSALTFLTPVPGGTVLSGTVTLSGVTPTDMVVGLSSSDSSVIRLHRAVIVPAGSSSATFLINTFRSHVSKTVTITAKLDSVTLTKDLTITGR